MFVQVPFCLFYLGELSVKCLYFLVGPKGSGKTYIGSLVGKRTDIHFLRVEDIWLSLRTGENGWLEVEKAIHRIFAREEKIMIETLGAGDEFHRFLTSLQANYRIKMIRVWANLDLCFYRVKNRNSDDHISVSDDKVKQYNEIAFKVKFDWDLEIKNDGLLSDDAIIEKIENLCHNNVVL